MPCLGWLYAAVVAAVSAQAAVEVALPATATVPASGLGHGYNAAFFERGVADALNEAATGAALAGALADLGVTGLRWPGGSFAYWYPPVREGLEAFRAAGFAEASYNLWRIDHYGWSSEASFLRFCGRNRLTAWYQLNPGYGYDAAANRVYQVAPLHRAKPMPGVAPADGTGLQRSLAHVRDLVGEARAQGADVVWEIGNEDYVAFDAADYAAVAAEFIHAIRRVDPQARVCVCGDSESWSERGWQTAVLQGLRVRGVDRLDVVSVHCYLLGVGEWRDGVWHRLERDTGRGLYEATVKAWPLIRGMYADYRRILREQGFAETGLAFTEFSVIGPDPKGWNRALEHSLGRALGEAAIFPNLAGFAAGLFFHDLVRSGPGEGNWFQRLDYHPEAPPESRYRLQIDAQALRLVAPHARGQVLYDDGAGTCVSCTDTALTVTLANPDPVARDLTLTLTQGACDWLHGRREVLTADSLDACDYAYRLSREAIALPAGPTVTLTAPPFGLAAYTFPRPGAPP